MKKRVCAALLACAVVFALSAPAAAAPADQTPIIMISGYTSIQLFRRPASDERERLWSLDFDAVGDALKQELPGLVAGGLLWIGTGCTKVVAKAFARAARRVLGWSVMNADGTPAEDTGPWPGTAADFSYAKIKAALDADENAPEGQLLHLEIFCRRFARQVSPERIFIFQYDWRCSNTQNAGRLRGFIKEVKRLTGSAKVRVFASSYGAQMCGVYLAEYARDEDISKLVMEVPALGGSSAVPDLLKGENFRVNIDAVVPFVQSYSRQEGQADLGFLWRLIPQKWLAPLATSLLQAGLKPIVKTWGSIWDLMPADQYGCDRLHREIMPRMGEILRGAQEAHGTAIRIVAGTGSLQLAGTTGANSDGLLDVQYTTGAQALPLGGHGLRQSGSVCADPAHRHLSPGEDIDASAAWLPENTWFVQGQFHGAGMYDPYTLELDAALMLDPGFNTVFDRPEFPQFAVSRQACRNIAAALAPDALRIDNVTAGCTVRVLSVCAPCGPRFSLGENEILPGETLRVPFTGAFAGGYTPVMVAYQMTPQDGASAVSWRIFDMNPAA